jgi:hypothetical protein
MGSTHYTWSQTFGGGLFDEGTAVVETSDSGFALSGRTANFGAVVGQDEVWLVRCDSNGNHLWNYTYGGDFKKGGYMSRFHKSVRLESIPTGGFLLSSHTTRYSVGDADGWLIRTDANGNHLWNFTYGGPDDEYFVESVACTAGGFASAGWTENVTLDTIDYWLIRTDANGNHLWNFTYGEPDLGEQCYDVIEVSTGGFLMVGWAGDFGPTDDSLIGKEVACWVVRVNANGAHLWNYTYGSDNSATYAVECQNGDFAFVGGYGASSTSDIDTMLIRIDASGQHLWNETYGDNNIECAFEFAECSDGGFAIFTLNYLTQYECDAWFVRTDASGTMQWNQLYGGSQFDQFFAGIQTSAGDFVMIGTTSSFGAGHVDMYVVRVPDTPPLIVDGPPPPYGLYVLIAIVIVVVASVILLFYRRRSQG